MEEMDSRLKTEIDREDPRVSRAGTASRRSREDDGREAGDRELSDSDRIEMFRQTLFNDVLPDLPPIPGFHVCWLSTTHQSDSIHRRVRLGYTPVTPQDVPGLEYMTLKGGTYDGLIGINEMLAYKLPMHLYQAYMQEVHHAEPAKQSEGIASQLDAYKEQAERDGGRIQEGDGMEELRRPVPSKGIFAD